MAATIGIKGRWRISAEPFSSRGRGAVNRGISLLLVFLQQALKLPALVFVQQLLDARFAVA